MSRSRERGILSWARTRLAAFLSPWARWTAGRRTDAWERHFNAALVALRGSDAGAGAALIAEKELRAALRQAERFAPGDQRLAATLQNLAMVCLAAHRPEEAERIGRRALEACEEAFGSGSSQLVTILGDLAAACGELGRAEEAARLRARAMAILEAKLGPALDELSASLDRATGPPKDPPSSSR